MLSHLKQLKSHVAEVKGTQLTDPDHGGGDRDDKDVMSALNAAEAAIDTAIQAQAKDCSSDDGEDSSGPMMAYSESESEDESTREEPETSPDAPSASPGGPEVPAEEASSVPAERAPVRGPQSPGATLRKRATPLRSTTTTKEPLWKL
jgi:hypothetical protein